MSNSIYEKRLAIIECHTDFYFIVLSRTKITDDMKLYSLIPKFYFSKDPAFREISYKNL